MRKPVIAGNWKLYKNIEETKSVLSELKNLVSKNTTTEIVIAPVFTTIYAAVTATAGSNVNISAQDCFWEKEGAFTGEVSCSHLKDVGCSHVIIGHSERRQYFGETDETVNKKVKSAVSNTLKPIVCVGETLQERENNTQLSVIEKQVKGALTGLSKDEMKLVIIAYEPVWAIGTGKTATDEQAQEIHAFIRNLLVKLYDLEVSENTAILYGGSVKPENIKALMTQPDIDGALVGGASLKAESFAAIANYNL